MNWGRITGNEVGPWGKYEGNFWEVMGEQGHKGTQWSVSVRLGHHNAGSVSDVGKRLEPFLYLLL